MLAIWHILNSLLLEYVHNKWDFPSYLVNLCQLHPWKTKVQMSQFSADSCPSIPWYGRLLVQVLTLLARILSIICGFSSWPAIDLQPWDYLLSYYGTSSETFTVFACRPSLCPAKSRDVDQSYWLEPGIFNKWVSIFTSMFSNQCQAKWRDYHQALTEIVKCFENEF